MLLLESMRTWWRRVTRYQPPAAIFTTPSRRSRVPDEYQSLHAYLEQRYASVVVLTFEQMESLLGFALPAPAGTTCEWWTGVAVPGRRYAEAWVGAGRTATPNLRARTVTFERVR
jgi:hypothetical protein